jgi:MFS-type transporter involved in bile tolerance (Atg22 family)
MTAPQPADARARFSWALFDFANSGFPTVVSTFIFSA